MTQDRQPDPFSELRGLMERASPTPWVMGKHEQVRSPDGRQVSVWGAGIAWASRDTETEANGALLVAAVNALPALLDERDRLIEALKPFAAITPSSLYAADGSDQEQYIVMLKDDWGNPAELTGADLALARQALSQEIG